MKGVFLNIRGLGKVCRKQCAMDTIAKLDLNFIGLQETKKECFQDKYLDELAGILLGVDSELLEIEGWIIREYSISCGVRCKKMVLSADLPLFMVLYMRIKSSISLMSYTRIS
jgi:hypothetical protein